MALGRKHVSRELGWTESVRPSRKMHIANRTKQKLWVAEFLTAEFSTVLRKLIMVYYIHNIQ